MEFWPTSLEEILGVALQFSAIAGVVGGVLWYFIKIRIDAGFKECGDAIEKEEEYRKLADSRIEEKLRTNNDTVHEALGKIAVIQLSLQEYDRKRVEDAHRLEMIIKDGLHLIQIEIEKIRSERQKSNKEK